MTQKSFKDEKLLEKRENSVLISVMICTCLQHITNVFKSGRVWYVAQSAFMGRWYVSKKRWCIRRRSTGWYEI